MKDTSDHRLIRRIARNPHLSTTTKDAYEKYIRMVSLWFPSTPLLKIMLNPREFYNTLERISTEKNYGDHQKDIICASIMALWKYNDFLKEKHPDAFKQWGEVKEIISAPIRLKYKSNEPTLRQKKGHSTYEEICEVRDSLPRGSHERLLLCIYTMIPPVRSDFNETKIYMKNPTNIDENNYIVLGDRPRLVLQTYKTKKKYGRIEQDLPEELVREISESLVLRPRDLLFISPASKIMNKKNFNHWANSTLKRVMSNQYITLTMFRHVYITRSDLKLHEKSGLEQEKVAKTMGHGIDMQRGYSWHVWNKGNETLPLY